MMKFVQRFAVCVVLAGTTNPVWAAGLTRGAIVGYGLTVLAYLMAQSLTGFRHYLHGALLTVFLAALYALLIPAIAKAS
jgi:hypothetical protein